MCECVCFLIFICVCLNNDTVGVGIKTYDNSVSIHFKIYNILNRRKEESILEKI